MPGNVLDLAIIGAGPCGIAAGAAAKRADLTATLFDAGPLCASLMAYPPYLSFFSTPEKLEIEGIPFVTAGRNPTRLEALVYYRKVARYFGLAVRQYEEVVRVVPEAGTFVLHTRKRTGAEGEWRARNVVVATGGFDEPNRLRIPGENLPKVSHHYTEAHPYWDQDVVVVGGGNSAVEAALELYRAEEIPNDWVLALTGWRPDPALLRSLGVRVDAETGVPDHDPETMETPAPGVFLAGVLAAGNDANRIFIENGRMHGRRIVDAILDSG